LAAEQKKQKPAEIIKLIEENDPSLTEADFAGSTIFALKSQALTEQLCAALRYESSAQEQIALIHRCCATHLLAAELGNH
jgi:hypothetical protein